MTNQVNKHFPQVPIVLKQDILEKFDIDTLFFIFFIQQVFLNLIKDPYMQYLATKRLKALKWMFHKKYQTWFQIIGQPKNQTNEYIEGTFYYFDFERGY